MYKKFGYLKNKLYFKKDIHLRWTVEQSDTILNETTQVLENISSMGCEMLKFL